MEQLNVVIDVSPAELQEVIEQSLMLARGKRDAPGREIQPKKSTR
jgi:hypothetical protein